MEGEMKKPIDINNGVLPCPFCGNGNLRMADIGERKKIICACTARVYADTEKEVIKIWNKRAIKPAVADPGKCGDCQSLKTRPANSYTMEGFCTKYNVCLITACCRREEFNEIILKKCIKYPRCTEGQEPEMKLWKITFTNNDYWLIASPNDQKWTENKNVKCADEITKTDNNYRIKLEKI
jgi:hypothetical protein